jgi:hypothetical protein
MIGNAVRGAIGDVCRSSSIVGLRGPLVRESGRNDRNAHTWEDFPFSLSGCWLYASRGA